MKARSTRSPRQVCPSRSQSLTLIVSFTSSPSVLFSTNTTEDVRFVAIAHFRKADENVVTEELKCSDAVALGLYTKMPFLMEDSVLSHATLISTNTIRTFEKNQALKNPDALMSSLDVPDDDLTKH